MILCLLLISFFSFFPPSFAQEHSLVRSMIAFTVEEMKNLRPEDTEEIIVQEATPWIPPGGYVDTAFFNPFLSRLPSVIRTEVSQNGYSIIDDKEYATNTLKITVPYYSLPNYRAAGVSLTVDAVTDSAGRNISLSAGQQQKYRELGIIDDGFGFTSAGEAETEIWLSGEPAYGEKIIIKGSLHIVYPLFYETIFFGAENIGQTQTIQNYRITLLQIEKDMAQCKIEGDRHFSDGVQKLFLNKDLKPFGSYHSSSFPVHICEAAKAAGYSLSEEKINELAGQYDIEKDYDLIFTVKISGALHKLVFYRAGEEKEKVIPFMIEFVYQ